MPEPSEQEPSRAVDEGQLRDVAERHKARCFVYRDFGPDERWKQHAVGLVLELRARVLGDRPLADVAAQEQAYGVLATLARHAFAALQAAPGIDFMIDAFDGHVIVEPAGSVVEVELSAHVFHRDAVRETLDDEERRAVSEVRARLRSLGVRD